MNPRVELIISVLFCAMLISLPLIVDIDSAAVWETVQGIASVDYMPSHRALIGPNPSISFEVTEQGNIELSGTERDVPEYWSYVFTCAAGNFSGVIRDNSPFERKDGMAAINATLKTRTTKYSIFGIGHEAKEQTVSFG